jgi:hypothetical protein
MRGLVIAMALASLLGGACENSRREDEPPATAMHRIIFELTSDDAEAWTSVLNNVENVKKALGATSIEVVAHGKGLALLTAASNADVYDRLKQSADGGVVSPRARTR